MNILYISEIEPFLINTGERLRAKNLINSLTEFSDKVFAIVGNLPKRDQSVPENLFCYQMPLLFDQNRRWNNFIHLFKRNTELVTLIQKIIETEKIDIAFLDYNFIGNYIEIFNTNNIKVIYGTHNVQSRLNLQTPAKTLTDKLYRILRYRLEMFHERYYLKKADAIIAVSEQDLIYYKKNYKKTRSYLIPNYIDERQYNSEDYYFKKRHVRFIMSGNFNAFQNKYGMAWFLKNVWDKELNMCIEGIFVGHGSIKAFNEIDAPYKNGISALGTVKDVKEYITESMVAIIPLLHGSGTRLKCIEAMALKTPIISTSIGVEGIDHDGTIVIANSAEEFKKALLDVCAYGSDKAAKAYQIFLKKYSSLSNTEALKKIIVSTINEEV